VCTENSVLIDYVTESPNVGDDDRSVLPFPGPVRLAVQVEEPTLGRECSAPTSADHFAAEGSRPSTGRGVKKARGEIDPAGLPPIWESGL
jgi:hypothetical protein